MGKCRVGWGASRGVCEEGVGCHKAGSSGRLSRGPRPLTQSGGGTLPPPAGGLGADGQLHAEGLTAARGVIDRGVDDLVDGVHQAGHVLRMAPASRTQADQAGICPPHATASRLPACLSPSAFHTDPGSDRTTTAAAFLTPTLAPRGTKEPGYVALLLLESHLLGLVNFTRNLYVQRTSQSNNYQHLPQTQTLIFVILCACLLSRGTLPILDSQPAEASASGGTPGTLPTVPRGCGPH